jgi:hypothetical protein
VAARAVGLLPERDVRALPQAADEGGGWQLLQKARK